MSSSDLYSRRGVSAKKEAVDRATAQLDRGLFPNAFAKVLPDVWGGDAHYCNLLHTDTAGTKPILAYLYWRETGELWPWRNIVQDALVMNLDDLACAGATDGFLVAANIARNRSRIADEVVAELIPQAERFLAQLGEHGISAQLAGGETADVGDSIRTLDLGYTIGVRLPRAQVIENHFQEGDVIVGLASAGQASYEPGYNSGIGCNGLTSARHDLLAAYYGRQYPESYEPALAAEVVYQGRYRLSDQLATPAGERSLGELLLAPTRTYLPVLKPILAHHRTAIHGIVHCTGGGQTKCLKFAGQGQHIVKDRLMPTPPIFQEIRAGVGTSWQEMYQTFNMGHRLEVFTDAQTAAAITALAGSYGIEAQVVGRVEGQAAEQPTLTIEGPEGALQYSA
jgi:phosphoribosylformylglycinamidine cyclo-ligase